jgi:hypothetical protein
MTTKGSDAAAFTLVGLALVAIIALVLVVLYEISAFQCNTRWELSGMKSEYRIVAGCLVEATPGKFIPERNYRAVLD